MSDASPAPEAHAGAAAETPAAELLDILVAPHPVLKQKARVVRPEDAQALRALLPRMFATMYHAPGIGLAAPQIGIGLRAAVVDVADEGERHPLVLINPEVIEHSDSLAAREEGCLSLPNQYAEVVRPEKVRVRFQDIEGRTTELEADGLLATCLQHEIDHLDGILFVDHLSTLKRNMVMRRLAKDRKTGRG
ncbi:peptide deformylase [Rhizosaccharibacter radicis]|uniref:Peptide deformylase n=1 Tax=Rhizosaccharibacter radicis TaxID=2782605 RepID=A0ABT1VVC6_9PROT|nr:peptide deformylase [Acetobacteraceae bacterium KSS12]